MDRRQLVAGAVSALTGLAAGAKVTQACTTGVDSTWVLQLGDEYLHPSEADVARMKAEWEKQWQGKAPRLFIVTPGCKLKPVGAVEVGETLGDYSYHIAATSEAEANRLLDTIHPKHKKTK